MDGFSYYDIFATKGIEYLAIISFFVLLIPFWLILNKKNTLGKKISKVLGVVSASILNMPKGLFYSKNHTWLFMEKSGNAKVGINDLLLRLTGEVQVSGLTVKGKSIKQGELLAEIVQNGKSLKIYSPISGKIVDENLNTENGISNINEDPYNNGWLYKISPDNWKEETKSCYFGEEAIHWSTNEIDRFKDFLARTTKNYSPETSMIIMQDGGEIREHLLETMPPELWNDFQNEFLTK